MPAARCGVIIETSVLGQASYRDTVDLPGMEI